MNRLSHTIRNFNRFELKYLITLQQAEKMKAALAAYLLPDEHGNNGGRYALASLYYDSPDLCCYREKQDGLRFRRKLRIRKYGSGGVLTDEDRVFVEIKQRVDRVTQKRRVSLTYANAVRLCNDRQLPRYGDEDKAIVEEAYTFLWQYNLQPANIVRYDRQAFIGTKYDIGLRVTFDTNLTFQAHPLHLHEQRSSLPMLPAQWVVMEIKVNDRMPRWLTDMIAVHDLQMQRISKYCRSVEAARNMPSLRWRRSLPERSRDVLSSSLAVFNFLDQDTNVIKH
jgi:SPX domain protein involved in polyphosphate accumulation